MTSACRYATALMLVALVAACTAGGSPAQSEPVGDASPSATPGTPGVTPPPASGPPSSGGPSAGALSDAQLKYRLIDAVGQPFFCDPDLYPVARADEAALAATRFAGIQADAATFAAIVARLGYDPAGTFGAEQMLAIYRQWKLLRAIQLEAGPNGWSFDVTLAGDTKPATGERAMGTITGNGTVTVASRVPAGIVSCPICLARGTAIATPGGALRVEDLRLGDVVWTFDHVGRRITGRVVALGSTPVPDSHRVVRLVLSDGRTLEASPGHPLLDGRPLGSLVRGDVVDGARVVSADLVPYLEAATYDLLASGPTGGYLADGVALLSTIGR